MIITIIYTFMNRITTNIIIIIVIIIHEFHRDASLETKLQGRYMRLLQL